MNKFKYIIFIIFGILLFLLWNTANTFSIGNQYLLDRNGNGLVPGRIENLITTNSNTVLKHMYDIIINPRENICLGNFEECYNTMDGSGGSCQLNTIIGLYQTALNVGFSQEDYSYINSQGVNISVSRIFSRIFDYLTNREIMKPLLKHNNIDPLAFNEERNIKNFKSNNLYPIAITFDSTRRIITYYRDESLRSAFTFGHALLMYNTKYEGLTNFITYLDTQYIHYTNPLYINLVEKKKQLEALPNENIRNNGIVCIIIDFCNKMFYAVTELCNPSTLDPNLFNDEGNIQDQNLQKYNELWKVKFVTQYLTRTSNRRSVSFRDNNDRIITKNFNDIVSTDLDIVPKFSSHSFLNAFDFFAYLPTDKVYSVDEYPDIKDRDEYLGYPNILCRDPEQVPRCRDPDYYCHRNFPVNNASYSVCKQEGELNTNCRDSIPLCNNDLYCDESENLCKKKGELNTPCKDGIQKCNNDDLFCNESANLCKQKGELNTPCRDRHPKCNDAIECIYNTCSNGLLLYKDSFEYYVFNTENEYLFQAVYIYNDNWNDGNQILEYRNIRDFYVPIYLGKYTKTAISFYRRNKIRDIYIQYDGNNLVLIDGNLLDQNVFTETGSKTIRRHDFWKVGKHGNIDSNFITIYFNDDTYTSLSPISRNTNYNINRLSNILNYLNQAINQPVCATPVTGGGR